MSGGHLSKEFFELVKSIGESRSKQEEDKIITTEIVLLKQHLSTPNITPKKMKEYMLRAVYAEMLGHDASFAYIHAVKLTHEKSLWAKRIGYLTCNLFLHKDHELMLLLINTMQRDLQSANHLEVCAALTAVVRLVNLEMIPAISPLIFKLLSHAQEVVRKKAVVTVNRFFVLSPDVVLDQKDMLRKILCDPDPSVMGASLHVLAEVSKANPSSCKDLVQSFVSILKQITEHRLPRDFDYHRIPAPWLQVKLLGILSVLGTADQKASEQMTEIIQEVMRRADGGVNAGYAIIYECVKCITRIYPDASLLELAASNISRFISSDNNNLKYLGVTGLALIVQVNASYAAEHQMVVVDCLENPDETLKRKTLDLLFRMTNPQNVTIVVEKLTFHLNTSSDVHLRRELVQRVTSLAERFAPDNEWYVNTMNALFELGGDLVPNETAYNLMRLVAEGTGEDETTDQAFRSFAVNTYLKLLEKTLLSDVLVQVIAWVLGEYGRHQSLDGYELEDVVDLLCEAIERPFEDASTRGYIVNAIMKLCAQNSIKSNTIDNVVRNYRSSRATDLQQRCYEFEQLKLTPALMRRALPYDASCEDIAVNANLSFLDNFVRQKISEGAQPYQDLSIRLANKSENNVEVTKAPTLNFTAYEAPTKPQLSGLFAGTDNSSNTGGGGGGGGYGGGGGGGGGNSEPPPPQGLNVSGPRKWGPAGYNGPSAAPPPAEKPPPRTEPPVWAPKAPDTSTTSATKAPEVKEPTEKEKMAAALFGGLGGGGGAAAKTSSAPKATPKPAAAATPAPPKAAAQAPAPPPPPASGGMDLLGFGDEDPSPAPAAAPATASPPAASSGLDDLLGFDMGAGGSSSSAPVQMPAPAAPAHILAPLQCTTAQVGQTWGSLASERKIQIATTIGSCQDLMQRLQSGLNVHPVQIIGMEGIAAGRVLPGSDPCFLHGKLAPGRLELLIRCQDAGVAQRIADVSTRCLA